MGTAGRGRHSGCPRPGDRPGLPGKRAPGRLQRAQVDGGWARVTLSRWVGGDRRVGTGRGPCEGQSGDGRQSRRHLGPQPYRDARPAPYGARSPVWDQPRLLTRGHRAITQCCPSSAQEPDHRLRARPGGLPRSAGLWGRGCGAGLREGGLAREQQWQRAGPTRSLGTPRRVGNREGHRGHGTKRRGQARLRKGKGRTRQAQVMQRSGGAHKQSLKWGLGGTPIKPQPVLWRPKL